MSTSRTTSAERRRIHKHSIEEPNARLLPGHPIPSTQCHHSTNGRIGGCTGNGDSVIGCVKADKAQGLAGPDERGRGGGSAAAFGERESVEAFHRRATSKGNTSIVDHVHSQIQLLLQNHNI